MMLLAAMLALAQAQVADTPRKTVLPAVTVEATAFKPARYNATTRFDEFYRRRSRGVGKFLTREDIEARARTEAVYLLEGLGGVRIVKPKNDQMPELRFTRCTVGPGGSQHAGVALFVDGIETSRRWVADYLHNLHVNDIEAMKVYTSPSQLPQEAMGNSCAAIFIWTRYTTRPARAREPRDR